MTKRKAKTEEVDFYKTVDELFSEYIVKDDEPVMGIIPTSSTSLNVATGVGGIPLGRFTEIYGAEAVGKTTLALETVKNALEMGYNVLYVDPEQGVDKEFARRFVGDLVDNKERFFHAKPKTMEQALNFCELGIKSGKFQLVVLDSIGGMSPKKVHDDKLEDDNVALVARRLGVFLDRNQFDVRYNHVAFIGINQIRDRVGSYIKFPERPGGHKWKHIISLAIELRKSENLKEGDNIIGIQSAFVIRKSKISPPFRSFYFPIIFDKGIDTERDTAEFARVMGIVNRAGPYYYFEEQQIGNGFNDLVNTLMNDKELLDKITKRCYNVAMMEVKDEQDIEV